MLTTAQIADRLDDRFRLLTSGNRTALPRQQTLRALIDWSWQLLSPAEQLLLQRLSIFAGGMNLETIEAIGRRDGLEAVEILDLLDSLINKSLVIAQRQRGQETRYRLLETIRHYALEQLTLAGEAEIFRHHHLAYFRDFAEMAEPLLRKSEQAMWLNRLEEELDNIRVALDWAQETDAEAGLRLIAALAWFCWSRGNIREMEGRLSHLLHKAAALPDPIRAKVLWAQGLFHNHFPQMGRAVDIFKESLALYRGLGDSQGMVRTCSYLGFALKQQGVIGESQAVLQEGLALARASGDPAARAAALDFLAHQGSLESQEEVWTLMKKSEALYRELGDASGLVMVLNHLGGLAMKQGEFATARSYIEESVALQEALGTEKIIFALINLGVLHSHLGDYALAQAVLEKAIFIIQQVDFPLLDDLLVRLGYVHLRQDNLAQAKEIFSKTHQHYQEKNDIRGMVACVEGLAGLALQQAQAEQALRLFAWAEVTRESIQKPRSPFEQADTDKALATIQTMMDEETFASIYAEGKLMTLDQVIYNATGCHCQPSPA